MSVEYIHRGLAAVGSMEEIPFRLHLPRNNVSISIKDPHVDWWFREVERDDRHWGKPAYITFPASAKDKVEGCIKIVREMCDKRTVIELLSPDWKLYDPVTGENLCIISFGKETRVRGMYAIEAYVIQK